MVHSSSSLFLCYYAVLLQLVLVVLLLCHHHHPHAKEIAATNEWQLLDVNDTVPAGLHIRMDMTTGEKWAKLMDDDDDDDDESNNSNDNNDNNRVTSAAAAASTTTSVQVMPDGVIRDDVVDDVDDNNKGKKKNDEIEYNYEAMHRTFSKLPLEEQERMGGIPQLPSDDKDNGSSSSSSSSNKHLSRAEYERRMKEIWDRRQAELRAFEEENVAEMPDIMKQMIARIQEYLKKPYGRLSGMVSVLEELEYQLTDLDMTRDFHTLGGWPLLSSLISDRVHNIDDNNNNPVLSSGNSSAAMSMSPQEYWQNFVYQVQTNAAWAMGTAVKNIEEFTPWAVEEVSIGGSMDNNNNNYSSNGTTTTTTPLDLLVLQLERSFEKQLPIQDHPSSSKLTSNILIKKLQQKLLYAIGAMLRGNRIAQFHLCQSGKDTILANTLEKTLLSVVERQQHQQQRQQQVEEEEKKDDDVNWNDDNNNNNNVKLSQRLLQLVDDIVSDLNLHPGQSPKMDHKILKSFSTETWCTAVLRGAAAASSAVASQQQQSPTSSQLSSSTLQETAIHAIQTLLLGGHCKEQWDLQVVRKHIATMLESWEIPYAASSNMDEEDRSSVHHQERRDLALAVLTLLDQNEEQ